MKKSILNKLVFLCALVLVSAGCRTRKPAVKPVVVPAPATIQPSFSKSEVLKKISDSQVKFNTMSIKAKADLNINNNSNDVTMNIHMQRDKVIWVSVTAIAGIEVARALITPDSIKILNRIESSYTQKPFSYIYQFASKQVTFKTLQDSFIGNALSGTLTETSAIDLNGGQAYIKGDLSGLTYHLIFNTNNNLIQTNLADRNTSQTLSVDYSDYASVSGQIIPQTVNIKSAASNKMISIDLKYNRIALNESVDFPFSVPKRFTVKN